MTAYVKKVTSPMKGGVNVELGPKTVLVGRNGGGKSAVLQAAKLAVAGYIDDQDGKDGIRSTAAIAELFPPGAELKSTVEMSEGSLFVWESKRKGKGFSKPKPPGGPRKLTPTFPFLELSDLLSGDTTRVKAWLEPLVGLRVSQDELVEALPPMQQEDGRRALEPLVQPQDRVSPVEMAAQLKSKARSNRTKATRTEKDMEDLIKGVPLPLSDAKLEEIRVEMAELERGLGGSAISPEQYAMIEAELHESIDAYAKLKEKLHELQATMEAEVAGDPARRTTGLRALSLIERHKELFGSDVCVVCHNREAEIDLAQTRWQALVDENPPPVAQAQYKALLARVESTKLDIQGRVTRFKALEVKDLGSLRRRRDELTGMLAVHKANRRLWKQAKAKKMQVATLRAQADLYTALARTWLEWGEDVLKQRVAEFEEKVSAWLPGGESFAVDAVKGRVGLRRGEVIHTALSGAERSRVLLAILSSVATDGPTLLDSGDKAWDPKTLSEVMLALTQAPHQVVLMSTVDPSYVPEGWTVVHVSRDKSGPDTRTRNQKIMDSMQLDSNDLPAC